MKKRFFASLLLLCVCVPFAGCASGADVTTNPITTTTPATTTPLVTTQPPITPLVPIINPTADAEWRTHPEDFKLVAFTFDDAPSAKSEGNNISTRLINLLNQYEGTGTFFATGDNIRANGTGLLEYALAHGFEIGNHTNTHPYLTELSRTKVKEEIVKVNELLETKLGYTPKYVRPGYVAVNSTVYSVATELNMPVIGEGLFDDNDKLVMLGDWSSDASKHNKDTIYQNCMDYAEDGSIILLHGWSSMTDEALAKLIPDMYAAGYRFVTLSELFAYHGIENVPTDRLIQCTSKLK